MDSNVDMRKTAIAERQRRKLRKVISVLITVLFIIMLILAVIAGIVAVVTALGESRLRNKVSEEKPSIVMEENNLNIDDILAGQTEYTDNTGNEEPARWEEGWVRYDGKIYEYNEDILTFLVMGIDKEGKVKENKDTVSGGQADALFLAVANPDKKSIEIIAINRDTMTEIQMYGYNESNQKVVAQIAAQHGFGDGMEKSCELTRDAVSKLFYDLPIHGYVSINMGAVAKLNDAIGGVCVTVLEDMTKVKKSWSEGTEVTLMGKDAYTYIRWRDMNEFESSRSRLSRQKQYISAFMGKAKEATKKDITLPITLYSEFSKYMVTDIEVEELTYLVSQLSDYEFKADAVYTLEGTTQMGDKHEEFYPDKDALKKLMIDIFYREVETEG